MTTNSKEEKRKAVLCECKVLAAQYYWSFYHQTDYIMLRLAKGKTSEQAVNIVNNTF